MLALQRAVKRDLLGCEGRFSVGVVELVLARPLLGGNCLLLHAVQLPRRAIEEREHPILVAGNDAGVEAVEQGAKKLALALESRLRVVPGLSLGGFLDGAPHRGRKASEAGLQDVVGRTAAQAVNRGFLSDRPRDKD